MCNDNCKDHEHKHDKNELEEPEILEIEMFITLEKQICLKCKKKFNDDKFSVCKSCQDEIIKKSVDKTNKCDFPGCKGKTGKVKIAGFNYRGFNFGIKCKLHISKGMIDIKHKKCNYKGCSGNPSYNYSQFTAGIRCITHILPGMINVVSKLCSTDGCETRPSYGFLDGKKEKCITHILPGMINLVSKMCSTKHCGYQASFGVIGNIPEKCSKHKLDNMINFYSKLCSTKGCPTYPSFGFPEGKREKCETHKLEGMINVISKLCSTKECETHANFGFPGKIREKCSEHKLTRMIDLSKKYCDYNECGSKASYNLKNEKIPIRCPKHADDNMINITFKQLCNYEDCETTASYGYLKDNKKLRCSKHSEDNMIDLKHKLCEFIDCTNLALYGIESKKPIRCIIHKEEKMLNVVTKKCNDEKCERFAYYGIPGNTISKCIIHKSEGMIFKSGTKCKFINDNDKKCKKYALYGRFKPLHCEDHKEDNEINLVLKNCKLCGLSSIVNEKGECSYHDPTLLKKSYLLKQNRVKTLMEDNKFIIYSYDKQIDGGICNRKRPDIIIDFMTHFIVIEVDENQHCGYDNDCEKIRMLEISQSLGMPVIFIRYNPDKYKPDYKEETKEIKLKDREKILIDCINKCQKNTPKENGYLRIIYLFFDNYTLDRNYVLDTIKLPQLF